MLPRNVRTLFSEVVTHQRREHQSERDKAVKEFVFKMARQGISQSSAFNDGKVEIFCEAFEKYATGVWDEMQRVMEGGFEVYPGCKDDLINVLKESLAAVYEADTRSLFSIQNNVHTPTARHLARREPRFEFRCRAVTEKLTTEIKIFVNQLRTMKEKEAKRVTIAGPWKNSWLQGLSAVLEASEQTPPDSLADTLEKGGNPYLAGLENIPVKPKGVEQAAADHQKDAGDAAAKQIQAATSELRAATKQLAEVAQPFREMYKDQRLVGAKADAMKAGIPELVVDVIVSIYHKSKLPTTDGLVKYLNSWGIQPNWKPLDMAQAVRPLAVG